MRGVVVYTCNTGGYDKLRPVGRLCPGIDYVCFTDDLATPVAGWQLRPMPEDVNGLSAVKQQRVVKIRPDRYLPGYDVSLYVDANLVICCDLAYAFVRRFDMNRHPLWAKQHPFRQCIYDEAKAVVKYKLDTPSTVGRQVEAYRLVSYPADNGLAETNVLLRRHNDPSVVRAMDIWEREVRDGSHRDQLSFDFACWKAGLAYGIIAPGYVDMCLRRVRHRVCRTVASALQWERSAVFDTASVFNNSFVISIDDAKLADFYHVMSAVFDGCSSYVRPRFVRGCTDTKIQPGSPRITKAHIDVVETAKSAGLPFAMIFEADAIPRPYAASWIERCILAVPRDCDVLLLGSNSRHGCVKVNDAISAVTGASAGSHAYIISAAAYDKFLRIYRQNPLLPIDHYFGKLVRTYISNEEVFVQWCYPDSWHGGSGYTYNGSKDHESPPPGFLRREELLARAQAGQAQLEGRDDSSK